MSYRHSKGVSVGGPADKIGTEAEGGGVEEEDNAAAVAVVDMLVSN